MISRGVRAVECKIIPQVASLRRANILLLRSDLRLVTSTYQRTRSYANVQSPKTKKSKLQKKIQAIQKISNSENSFQNESTSYILGLLNKNNEPKNLEELEKHLSPVISMTVAESINFEKLIRTIPSIYKFSEIIPDEVVNVKVDGKDLMILSNGTLVGWGFTEEAIESFLSLIKNSLVEMYKIETEEMDWVELKDLPSNPLNNGNSYLLGEIIVIQGSDKSKRLLDKTAFAIGLSRSTRLSVLEDALEHHLLLTRKNSENLSKGVKISGSESTFLRLTGRLFLLRGKLNLYSELIETPDVYWTEPTLERIYESVSRVLDINPRISILNRKLDYATEEQRALLGVLSEKKGARLEWIIIILIMVEVGFESFHFYERYGGKNNDDID
ncbi:uncharacterized protein PRCAT00005412001 [Priceomyces carsonii]|uniref:uncharacterized protein n=1 Tax=Priceomyces carsonii TaxID=28549 RepID=UPI002ED8AC2B|nr:unnamed protein product [Priceomyces carsonii]